MPCSTHISFELSLGYPQPTCQINYSIVIGSGHPDGKVTLGRSLSLFLKHEAIESIATPPWMGC